MLRIYFLIRLKTALIKISAGLFLAVPSYIIIGYLQQQMELGVTPSISGQVIAYVILTASEVLISITCLEFSYTQAPNNMKSFIMGFFMLSVALGNTFTALFTKIMPSSFIEKIIEVNDMGIKNVVDENLTSSYFYFYAMLMLTTALLFLFILKTYKTKTYLHDEK